MELCGREIAVHFDTGASLSIMSEERYDNLINFGLDLPLEDCPALITFTVVSVYSYRIR